MCLANTQQRVVEEVGRQDAKWGPQSHPNGTYKEHAYQARNAQERCDLLARQGRLTWWDILLEEVYEAGAEEDTDALIEELIQVAAVAVNWVRDLRLKRDFG